jgi:3-hydroxy acid dehydrogenase/malonic semialdehyde reductase
MKTHFHGKNILITGASSGIGHALAMKFNSSGARLFLLARREERLENLARSLTGVEVHLLVTDINSKNSVSKIQEATSGRVDILINNAGLALGREKVEESNFSDWEKMIETNITANFKIAHLIVPWMIKSGGGDIINLCSIAGHYAYPGGAVYCATKHAVHAFTRALREETCGRNIRVMQISPGMVNTEFSQVRFKGDLKAAEAVYSGMTPLTGEDIADMMMFMLERPRHVVIDELITMPADQGSPMSVFRKK